MNRFSGLYFRLSRCFVFIVLIFFSLLQSVKGQDSLAKFWRPAKTYDPGRARLVGITSASIYTGSMIFLYTAWYKGYELGKFHSFNDNDEWLQMDKSGHLFNSYNIARYASELIRWTGAGPKSRAWEAAGVSLLCMSSIEVFDGFSKEWGFSFGDMAVNMSGAGVFLLQELTWKEQRIRVKYSYHPSPYAKYRPNLLGKNFGERVLKDYNAQSHWLSFNLSSFASESTKIPSWLSLALGYSADGMIGGRTNPEKDADGNPYPHFERSRRFFLSADIELSRIKTKSRGLARLLGAFSLIKIPMPALEYNSNGKMKFHPLYF